MGRQKKDGLSYFSFDVDFFEDEKIEAISVEFGIKGEIIAIRLLCAIYRHGYFAEWTEMLKMKLLKAVPMVSAELLEQIVNRLVKWGFFDRNLFDSVKILTSASIQRRYFEAIKRRKPESSDLPYLLIQNDGKNIYVDINPAKNDFKGDFCIHKSRSSDIYVDINPQSKVKESKVYIVDDDLVRAQAQNAQFLDEYFSGKTDLMPLLMQLRRENAATSTLEDFKNLASLVICEWEQNHEKPAPDYTSWAKRLIAQIRIKNRILKDNKNDTANTNRQSDAEDARRRRDESFARHVAEKLGRAEMPGDIPRTR